MPQPLPRQRLVSNRAVRIAMIAITTLGLCVASYLTYVHYAGVPPLCGTTHNTCLKVQTSVYSELAGVPVALIGLIGYVTILGSLLLAESEESRFATMTLTVVGFGFSAYLTYRELFTLHEICEWCVSSAIMMTVLACLAVFRFMRGEVLPPADAGGRAELDPAAPLSAAGS